MIFSTAKLQYGRVVVVTPQGSDDGLCFRPLTSEELRNCQKSQVDEIHDDLSVATKLCDNCHLGDPEDFNKMLEYAPLCVEAILGKLMDAAVANQKDIIRKGVSSWRASERNSGQGALNILELFAYKGGDWNERQFAGALMFAEGLSSIKGIGAMIASYMKAMSKRGR